MIFALEIKFLPNIKNIYSVKRRTIWQAVDPDNILIYIKEGHCKILMQNETYFLNPGDLFFIPFGQNYIRYPIENEFCTMTYIHFSSGNIDFLSPNEAIEEIKMVKEEMDNNIISGNPQESDYILYLTEHMKTHAEHKDEVQSIYKKIFNEVAKSHLESAFNTSLLLCNILSIGCGVVLDSLIENIVISNSVPNKLKKAIAYIRLNYTRNITLDDLCKHCAVTKQQMIRYFNSALNITPTKYIINLRIARAKEMLLTNDHLSIAEVALSLGYEDPHYFSRQFTKIAKETPSHYIKRVRNFDEKKQ